MHLVVGLVHAHHVQDERHAPLADDVRLGSGRARGRVGVRVRARARVRPPR